MNIYVFLVFFVVFCLIAFCVSKINFSKKETYSSEEALKKSLNMNDPEFKEFIRKRDENPEYNGIKNNKKLKA